MQNGNINHVSIKRESGILECLLWTLIISWPPAEHANCVRSGIKKGHRQQQHQENEKKKTHKMGIIKRLAIITHAHSHTHTHTSTDMRCHSRVKRVQPPLAALQLQPLCMLQLAIFCAFFVCDFA